MKIVNVEHKESSWINKDVISSFGQKIYQCPEVDAVFIQVSFKDGSNIGFRKEDTDDETKVGFKDEEDE